MSRRQRRRDAKTAPLAANDVATEPAPIVAEIDTIEAAEQGEVVEETHPTSGRWRRLVAEAAGQVETATPEPLLAPIVAVDSEPAIEAEVEAPAVEAPVVEVEAPVVEAPVRSTRGRSACGRSRSPRDRSRSRTDHDLTPATPPRRASRGIIDTDDAPESGPAAEPHEPVAAAPVADLTTEAGTEAASEDPAPAAARGRWHRLIAEMAGQVDAATQEPATLEADCEVDSASTLELGPVPPIVISRRQRRRIDQATRVETGAEVDVEPVAATIETATEVESTPTPEVSDTNAEPTFIALDAERVPTADATTSRWRRLVAEAGEPVAEEPAATTVEETPAPISADATSGTITSTGPEPALAFPSIDLTRESETESVGNPTPSADRGRRRRRAAKTTRHRDATPALELVETDAPGELTSTPLATTPPTTDVTSERASEPATVPDAASSSRWRRLVEEVAGRVETDATRTTEPAAAAVSEAAPIAPIASGHPRRGRTRSRRASPRRRRPRRRVVGAD